MKVGRVADVTAFAFDASQAASGSRLMLGVTEGLGFTLARFPDSFAYQQIRRPTD
jgi:hypothetical protein